MTTVAKPRKTRRKTLMRIENYHGQESPACLLEKPGPSEMRSYFENEHGEQWVFCINRDTGDGYLHGGDIGWDDPIPFKKFVPTRGIMMSDSEKLWLHACVKAAVAFKSKIVQAHALVIYERYEIR